MVLVVLGLGHHAKVTLVLRGFGRQSDKMLVVPIARNAVEKSAPESFVTVTEYTPASWRLEMV
jgi:hypothetical protein